MYYVHAYACGVCVCVCVCLIEGVVLLDGC